MPLEVVGLLLVLSAFLRESAGASWGDSGETRKGVSSGFQAIREY
jgi:hypothetical protein